MDERRQLTLRTAGFADVDAVVRLSGACAGGRSRLTRTTVCDLLAHDWLLVLAEEDGEIVGTVHVAVTGPFCVIDHLLVDPRYAASEMRTLLLDTADAFCATFGTPEAVLPVAGS
jgi:N-acetylglutamate synthase-like GNAT family acetyltransferase